MSWVDERGSLVRLGARLTVPGGEGVIYELANDPGRVAKIYHRPDDRKAAKLRHLRTISSQNLLGISAWPVELLFDGASRQEVRGFLMARVNGKEIHKLYGPHDRYSEFPSANWEFLIHVAKNSAAAFETLHEHGVVMADVNEKNLLVTREGFVRLIDCDSYQVANGRNVFHCDVGVPLWTPPELQGRDYRSLVRTGNHDRFGLAVLIFHLLFMGRHPFAGVPDRPEEFEIDRAIGNYLFAFTAKTRSLGIRPPPHALPLNALPDPVVHLCERAFLRNSERDNARPTGREWYAALDILEKNLRACSSDPSHKYPAHLPRCPWCAIQAQGGPNFFISVTIHFEPLPATGNVASYWAAIERVTPIVVHLKRLESFYVPTARPNPARCVVPVPPSPAPAPPAGDSSETAGCLGGIGVIVTVLALFGGALPVAGIAGGATALVYVWVKHLNTKKEQARSAYNSAKAKYDEEQRNYRDQARAYEAEKRGRQGAVDSRKAEIEAVFRETAWRQAEYQRKFQQLKEELESRYRRYVNLDSEHKAELRGLEQRKRELQLNEFLDKKLIRNHRIKGIGPQKEATLLAYGVESALDISGQMSVPGIGPHLTSVLMDWRRRCEAEFRFNPSAPLPSPEVAALRIKYAQLRQTIETELRGGSSSLTELGMAAKRHIENAEARIPCLLQQHTQAVADLSVFS